jgi:hypothetical protein
MFAVILSFKVLISFLLVVGRWQKVDFLKIDNLLLLLLYWRRTFILILIFYRISLLTRVALACIDSKLERIFNALEDISIHQVRVLITTKINKKIKELF